MSVLSNLRRPSNNTLELLVCGALIQIGFLVGSGQYGHWRGFASFILIISCLAFFLLTTFYPRSQGYIFEPIHRWWWFKVRPGYYGVPHTGGGIRILRRSGLSGNVIFNLDGQVLGDEDYALDRWHYHPVDSDRRYKMPAIAFWLTKRRKPKLP